MNRLLLGRAQAGGAYRQDANGPVKPFGMALGFLSLLFAVLASGCQLSDLSVHERELTSWVYGKAPESMIVPGSRLQCRARTSACG